MGLVLGVGALFFGVVFIIVGWKGGGPQHMEQNLVGMMKGEYLPVNNPPPAAQSSGGSPSTSTSKNAGSSR